MIKKRIPEQYRRAYWIYSRAGLVLVAVGGSYLILSYFTSLRIGPRLTATGIIASGILTFALIAVYRDIGRIQEEQAEKMGEQRDLQEEIIDIQNQQNEIMSNQEDLMERQSEILAAELEPEVIYGEISYDCESFRIQLKNVGENVAKYFRLGFDISPEDDTIRTHSSRSYYLNRPESETGGYYEWVLPLGEEAWFETEIQSEEPFLIPDIQSETSAEFEIRIYYQYQGRIDGEVYQRAVGKDTIVIERNTTTGRVITSILSDKLSEG